MTGEGHGKRRRSHPARWPARSGRPAASPRRDEEGLIVDWLGVQATGGGGASTVTGIGCIFALTALRAGPYLVRRLQGRPGGRQQPSSMPEDRR